MKSVAVRSSVNNSGVSEFSFFFIFSGLGSSLIIIREGLEPSLELTKVGFNLRELLNSLSVNQVAVISEMFNFVVLSEALIELNLVSINKLVLHEAELSRDW